MTTIILPGMGANSKMYPQETYSFLEDVMFINWPIYNGEVTLHEIAKRIISQYQIKKEMVVGGSSLGGMVSIEIAKLIGNKKVILIGSATQPEYINPLLQKLSGLAEFTPVKIIQVFAGKIHRYSRNELFNMFAETNSEFIKAMCKALFNWEGLGDYNCEICHIHGQKDKVIFPPQEYAEIIPGAGHLISLSHASIVADFINKNIQ